MAVGYKRNRNGDHVSRSKNIQTRYEIAEVIYKRGKQRKRSGLSKLRQKLGIPPIPTDILTKGGICQTYTNAVQRVNVFALGGWNGDATTQNGTMAVSTLEAFGMKDLTDCFAKIYQNRAIGVEQQETAAGVAATTTGGFTPFLMSQAKWLVVNGHMTLQCSASATAYLDFYEFVKRTGEDDLVDPFSTIGVSSFAFNDKLQSTLAYDPGFTWSTLFEDVRFCREYKITKITRAMIDSSGSGQCLYSMSLKPFKRLSRSNLENGCVDIRGYTKYVAVVQRSIVSGATVAANNVSFNCVRSYAIKLMDAAVGQNTTGIA